MRKIPILPTLIVLVAAGVMVRLGFWQISRLHEKEALLAHYAAARGNPEEVEWPSTRQAQLDLMYRRARFVCASAASRSSMAGTNASGESGVSQTVQCAGPGGTNVLVELGWSREPVAGEAWGGGTVHGVIAPGPRLVADPPLAGLDANEIPDPSSIPNNHLSYAVQWFLFAATALVIYALALRKRWRG